MSQDIFSAGRHNIRMPLTYLLSSHDSPIAALLVRLRWVSLLLMLALAAIAQPLLAIELPLLPTLCVVAVGIVTNTLCWWVLSRAPEADLALAVLVCETLTWTGYLFLTGGATNPLISVLLPIVAIGATVLDRMEAWFLGWLSVVAFALLWRMNLPMAVGSPETALHLHLLGMWLTFAMSVVVTVAFISRLRQRIERQRQALAQAQEQHLRDDWILSLGHQAASTAHELSTPLATLNLLTESLQAELADHRLLQEDLQEMRNQLQRCKSVLKKLTETAGQTPHGGVVPQTITSWLSSLVQGWQSLRPETRVALACAAELQCTQLAASPALESTLLNLLNNAANACTHQVKLTASRVSDELEIIIEDDGPGIAPETLAALNGPPPLRSANGMGIGLFLSRAAIERLHGSLTYARPSTGGTRVEIRLPLTLEPT